MSHRKNALRIFSRALVWICCDRIHSIEAGMLGVFHPAIINLESIISKMGGKASAVCTTKTSEISAPPQNIEKILSKCERLSFG